MRMKGYPKVSVSKLGSLKKGGAILREKLRPDGAAVCLYGDIYTKYAEVVTSFISRVEPSAVADGVRINTGDVVFAGSGETAEEIGKCIAYVGNEEAYAGGDVVILSSHGQDARYLGYVLNAEDAVRQKMRLGQGSSVMHLYKDDVGSIKIPLPPLAEQRKIAEILRTWDEAIETAEAELKAKQERKRGLMIKCLGPAIEARGVNGWRTVRLGEICNPQQWATIVQSQMTETGIPVYGANSYIGFFSEANHEDDVIAVSCRGSCGEVAFVSGPSYVTGNSMCLDDLSSEKVNIYWLYQCLKLRGFRDIISGSAQPQIIRKDVIKVKISLPPLPAQEKTAEVLLSADHDIETINNRIESLRTQKRGLMQKLLTGEVRVAA